ncbi:hypothetical protein F5X68DRAFT_201988 [Plectosphaerella plurivora]|uniref:Chromo domain-containing protein n=1 Tax=Plectosphaerella plurivora TaxID=936078 RepID=A0A9P8VGB8_9PEZI|nr:hypothetical protein F5X68DRAFT_201988 [Plectosphaerella plurivora]
MSLPKPTPSSFEGQKPLPLANVEKPVAWSKLEVAIKPTRYVPGTGPPLRPITLLPRADTTAYIRGEFIVPRTASGDGKVHVVYLVGWTDLTSARLTVDAANILDYVSEREYERWNFERSEERDELERKLEEEENVRAVELAILAEQQEEQRQQEEAALRNGASRLTGSESSRSRESSQPTLQKQKKTKQGRPKAPAARTQSLLQQQAVILGSSLGETEGDSSDNDEDAISRQLREEQDELAMETDFLEPPTKKRRTVSPIPPSLKPVAAQQQRLSTVAKPPTAKSTARISHPPAPAPKRETPVPIPGVPARRPLSKILKPQTPIVAGPSRFPGSLSEASTANSSRSTSFETPPGKGKAKLNGTSSFKPVGNTPQPSTVKKAKKPKPPKPDPSEIVRFEANQDWEVKRLLETKTVKEGGKPVRLFLVLWKGEWPPDQNPTWEPEDNIPKKMARKFLARARAANMGMDGEGDTPPSWRPERTFSSVPEAIAGDAEEDPDEGSATGAEEGHDWDDEQHDYPEEVEDEDEVLLVTDEPTPHRTPFTPSNLDWEMAMGRRFGESLAG